MSISGFVLHGDHVGILGVRETKLGDLAWPIVVFDIDEDAFLGAKYPDGAHVASPRCWFPDFESELLNNRDRLRREKEANPPPAALAQETTHHPKRIKNNETKNSALWSFCSAVHGGAGGVYRKVRAPLLAFHVPLV